MNHLAGDTTQELAGESFARNSGPLYMRRLDVLAAGMRMILLCAVVESDYVASLYFLSVYGQVSICTRIMDN